MMRTIRTLPFAARTKLVRDTALASVLALSALAPELALAQSTATQELEEMIVMARKREAISGIIVPQDVPKARSTITDAYIESQQPGQSIAQSLNLVPGVNFTNSDPYGNSGGNIRLRSFDGARVALILDGVPLNDSGNYASFFNQMIDSELIAKTDVNLGSTDVDSPTAAGTGGTINITTKKPNDEAGLLSDLSVGSFDYKRVFIMGETGRIGKTGLSAFASYSYTKYDKFKGPGDLRKKQYNARVYDDLGGGDFVSVSFHYNQNRNAFYRNLSLADIAANGYGFDNDITCTRPTPSSAAGAAGVQNEASGGSTTSTTSTCTNYYGVRINPSNTGNLRAQSSFGITDKLRFTFDPSFQYVLANGGGITVFDETDGRLRGLRAGTAGTGTDLNGDGDARDRISLYSPNNTNTRRWGVNSSLIYSATPNQIFMLAYTFDYAIHRQTGQAAFLDAEGNPASPFGGLKSGDILIGDGSGADLRTRDRKSIAQLNQVAFNYSGKFFDDVVTISAGVRAPFFERRLNQYCYTSTATSGVTTNNFGQYCSTQPIASVNPNGTVRLVGSGTTDFFPPYTGKVKVNRILPNVGVAFRPFGQTHTMYLSYTEGLAMPRTDNLYSREILDVVPERARTFDLGYRYQKDALLGAVSLWRTSFKNRIVSANDPVTNVAVDRNLGDVVIWGVDGQVGAELFKGFTIYGSASYDNSEVQQDLQVSPTKIVATKGKKLVETPDWTVASRIQYIFRDLTVGVQGKYVGKRFATDVNDQYAPSYVVFDGDIRYSLAGWGWEHTYLQLNAINILDRNYLGSIPTTRFDSTSVALYSVGAPRTIQFTLHSEF